MKRLLAFLLVIAMVATLATFPVAAEDALITGITVTGEGITSGIDGRTLGLLVNGVSGEGMDIAWGDELFVSAETFAPGDGTSPLFSLTFDLGAKYDVSRFFVGIGWDTGDITAADLYGSNDGGATWTPVKTGLATGWSAGFDGGDMIGVDLTNASYSMFKLEVMNVSKEATMQIHEIEFTGSLAEGGEGEGGEDPIPTPPPAGSGAEQKVALTVDNVTFNRYFASSGWSGPDGDFDESLIVDGSPDTYSFSTVWGNGVGALNSEAFDAYELIIDLGSARNVSKINVYTGLPGYGNGWQFAASMNPEILVAGEDGVYDTSVYTYTTTEGEADRLDTVTLDPAGNGAAVRYIKYTFTDFSANVTIAEVEVYETTTKEPTSYTVNYVDEEGNPVADPKVVEGKLEGEVVTETAPVLEGYYNVNTTESITLVVDPSENVITFNYITRTTAAYTVNYVDAAGNPVADAKVVDHNVFVDDEITEYAITVPGYSVDGDAAITKTLVDGENVFTFTYKVYNSISGPHSAITGLTGADVTTDVAIDVSLSNLDKLFDGDTYCYGDSAGVPEEGNGLFDTTNWYSAGEKVSVIVDLGDIYELSEVGTYWGWAPDENPNWNNWQYNTPSGYTIYAADTLEGLDTAAPVFVREGLKKDDKTLVGNDVAAVSCWGRFVKIEAVMTGGNFALREITFMGAEYIDPDNNTTVTFEYKDENGNELVPAINVTKTTDKVVALENFIAEIIGYVPNNNPDEVAFDEDKVVVIEYKAIPSVVVAPAEEGTTSVGTEKAPFVFTIATPENVSPEAEFAAANWATDNCEVVDVKVVSDGMYGTVYGWKVIVTVAPTDVDAAYSATLDLPDTYEQNDVVSFARTPSKNSLDSAIAVGENTIDLSATTVEIKMNEMGMVETDRSKRTVSVVITTQTIEETLLPYKGYENVVVEVKNVESAGIGFSYKADDFVMVGNKCYGSLLAHKYGADQLKVTVAIYGIEADGTKTELDSIVVKSEILQVVEPEKKPEATPAERLYNKIIPTDILAQVMAQVNPWALPEISEADWALFNEVSELRSAGSLDQLKADYEAYRASEPTGNYTDNLVIDVAGKIEASVNLWNFLKDIKVDTITFTGLPFAAVEGDVEGAGDIEDVTLTVRNGIDYDKLNVLSGGDFNLRVRVNLTEADPSAKTIGKAYNAVRRALNDDQVMPLFFRLDWYTWADLPFTSAVFTVKVSENWIDNNGRFNMVAYHVEPWTYDYDKDNTPTITKVEEDLTIMPITNEIKFAVDGGSNGSQIYDAYVIVSTNKLPSELPESIG